MEDNLNFIYRRPDPWLTTGFLAIKIFDVYTVIAHLHSLRFFYGGPVRVKPMFILKCDNMS